MATDDLDAVGAGKLPRVLGRTEALAVIVGSVIGSGIFIVPAGVARDVPSLGWIVVAWVVGGLFSLAGALTLAELGAMLPHAGGPYVYLRAAYGKVPAFLFGWTEFLVIRAGSVATLAAAFALYFSQLVPAPAALGANVWQMLVATVAMLAVATINIIGTKASGRVQVVGTVLKVGALVTMIVLPFLLGKADPARLSPVWPSSLGSDFFRGFMLAMVGVLWTYDGWVNSSSLAEEIRDPGRNIPWSLTWGMAILISVYLLMTLVYHMVLPFSSIQEAAGGVDEGLPRVVAAVFWKRLCGPPGLIIISLVVMCSTLISLNGNALVGPRAYFAMARDGLFPRFLSHIHRRYETPANAIAAQAVWSILLTIIGTAAIVAEPPSGGLPAPLLAAWQRLHRTPLYDLLYSYVIFGGTVIYTMTITSVFVLRVRRPDLHRPYRTLGYPVTPLLYVGASGLLMANMLQNNSGESLTGLLIILMGLPAYLIFSRQRGK